MAKSKKNTKKSSTKKTNTTSKNARKEEKNATLKKIEKELDEGDSIQSKVIVVAVVIIFLALFYLLAIHITNKNANSNNNKKQDEVTDYSEIIAGNSFNRNENEYLVVYYDKGNEDLKSTIDGYVTSYDVKDNSLTIYTVDMSKMFNADYSTLEETNKEPKNAEELKINGPTLIKFHKGVVEDYIEGIESINEYLQN